MSKRRIADHLARLLREADRDLAKGLTVADVCRKHGLADNTYYRWRQRHDPAKVEDGRHGRELQGEGERLNLLVAELLLDQKMLQDGRRATLPQRLLGSARPALRLRAGRTWRWWSCASCP